MLAPTTEELADFVVTLLFYIGYGHCRKGQSCEAAFGNSTALDPYQPHTGSLVTFDLQALDCAGDSIMLPDDKQRGSIIRHFGIVETN